jgi:hypothetical protein
VCALRCGPTVLHFRDFLKERRSARRVTSAMCARPTTGLAISTSVAKDLREALPELETEVVYVGIDTDALCPGPRAGDLLSNLAGLPSARRFFALPERSRAGYLGVRCVST